MSIIAPNQNKKKFTGFTSFSKNPAKKNVKAKKSKPFTGFSEFYKKLKEYEANDFDDYDSQYDPFIPIREKEKKVELPEEPPKPPDKHFKPQGYFVWCKDRTKQALERYADENGIALKRDDGNGEDTAESIKTTPLFVEIQTSSRRKYEDYRKYYDQSTRGSSSQVNDINPWFHKMLNKLYTKKEDFNEERERENDFHIHELRNLYQKLSDRQKLQLIDEFSRNVNTYPGSLQVTFLNRRLKRCLELAKCKNIDETGSHASISPSEKFHDMDFSLALPTERKELEDYFNKVVKSKVEIDFKPQDFKTWHTKMSFTYDRRKINLPKMSIAPDMEDFDSWKARYSEEINRNDNKFLKAYDDMKNLDYKSYRVYEKGRRDDFHPDFMSDLSNHLNRSISNLSSCRSMFAERYRQNIKI